MTEGRADHFNCGVLTPDDTISHHYLNRGTTIQVRGGVFKKSLTKRGLGRTITFNNAE